MSRRVVTVCLSTLATVLAVPVIDAAATPLTHAPVDPRVSQAISAQGRSDFWIDFQAVADLTQAQSLSDWTARGHFVVDRLQSTARSSQTEVSAYLRDQHVRFQPFWATNAILVHGGNRGVLEAVTARPEVRRIAADRIHPLDDPRPAAVEPSVGGVEWGVANVGAAQVWSDLGVRGDGVVVGSIDTGVQFDHPALLHQYRGSTSAGVVHDYNWFDPSGVCGPTAESTPCDDVGHGTHTVGTMVGDDGTNHIGVAPGARWIAAKGCQSGGCTNADLIASGQWMLAPTKRDGSAADVARRPNVINNSWGTDYGADQFYEDVVAAWRASGIFPAFANGNAGEYGCGTVGAPGSYPESYGVGAYDINNDIAYFSSRGPSPIDGSIRPNASAPGVNVRSSVPGNDFESFSGTSMATPHLSGTVALILSAAPALIGDVDGIADLLDQTARDAVDSTGCGGTPADNNTFGEGRIDALAAVEASPRGDSGTLAGRVTGLATGVPIAGAQVLITGGFVDRTLVTDASGRYHVIARAGDYDVTVNGYGWHTMTRSGHIASGTTRRLNFALEALPVRTVTGRVRDGSGHGWPMYARVEIAGYPGGPVFTDPMTGRYSVTLLEGMSYRFTVRPATTPGYEPTIRDITVPASATEQNFRLVSAADCTVPGYRSSISGLYEAFDDPTAPPGWSVVDDETAGQVWRFDDPAARGNRTGGDGGFAIVDSDFEGGAQNTSLISPSIDLSSSTAPVVQFTQDLRAYADEQFEVDTSVDDGMTWQNIWHHAAGQGDLTGAVLIEAPQLAGRPDVRVRFHYFEANFAWWWEVDDVAVGQVACTPVPGALVVGTTTDRRTGAPLTDVRVTAGETTVTSAATPADEAVPDGFYSTFVPVSAPVLTGRIHLYQDTSVKVPPRANVVQRADLAMRAGHLVVSPARGGRAELGRATTTSFTVTNDGSAPARFDVRERATGFAVAGSTPSAVSIPVKAVTGRPTRADRRQVLPPDAGEPSRITAWTTRADYPTTIFDNAVAVRNGKVYSVGGYNYTSGDRADLYIYDPADGTWHHGRGMPVTHDWATASFIDDRLYVFGGFDPFGDGMARLDVYDLATDSWHRLADATRELAGADSAVLDGKLYVIGGCSPQCSASAAVLRFDPETGIWTELGDYPSPAIAPSCGVVDGTMFCAGGFDGDLADGTHTYEYEPTTDTWLPRAPLPIPLWGSTHAAANGMLVVSGGISDEHVTNASYGYQPFGDKWIELPPGDQPTYRAGGACGVYRVGGLSATSRPLTGVSQLTGFDDCALANVPWLAPPNTATTVQPGRTVTVDVALDAGAVPQPGHYRAELGIRDDTPSGVDPVSVRLRVTPPSAWGKVTGTITGLGHCDTEGAPLRDVTVTVDGVDGTQTAHTDGAGRYALWLDADQAPLKLRVGVAGFIGAGREGVPLSGGGVSTADFALRRDTPCASAAPRTIRLTADDDQPITAAVRLHNRGAAAYEYTAQESPFVLRALPAATAASADVPQLTGPMSVRHRTTSDAPASSTGRAFPSWFGGAGLDVGLARYAIAQCDGDPAHAYVFSGVDQYGNVVTTSRRFDVAANTWEELAPVPAALEGASAVCELGRIHLLGGSGTGSHFVYDIASDTWLSGAPVPRTVWGAATAAWNGKIYLAGGDDDFNPGGTSHEVDVYDTATDSWRIADRSMPRAAVGAGHVQVGPYLYLAGGWDDASPAVGVSATQRLDLTTGRWATGPTFRAGRGDFTLVATRTALYAIGGDESGGSYFDASAVTDRLALRDWPGGRWKTFDPLPIALTANSGGFCSTGGLFARAVWTVGGADGYGNPSERVFLHDAGAERCPTVRADVPWLTVRQGPRSVAGDGSAVVTVVVDPARIQPGTTRATLVIRTTDPVALEFRVPIKVTRSADGPQPVVQGRQLE